MLKGARLHCQMTRCKSQVQKIKCTGKGKAQENERQSDDAGMRWAVE